MIRRRLTSIGVHSRGRVKSPVEMTHWIFPAIANGSVMIARIPTRVAYSRSATACAGNSTGRWLRMTSRPRWSCSKYQGKSRQI